MTPDPKKQSIIKAPSRAVAKARTNMASRALASVHKTTITNSIGMKLKLIPAGEFLMGSPESEYGRSADESQHRVRLTKPFYMQATTVTQSQWASVMGSEPWVGKNYVKQGPDYPATYVSHDDAIQFCQQLSERENAPYRLPTEAEWEYACRAGSKTAYIFGDTDADEQEDEFVTEERLDPYAWCFPYAGDDEDHARLVGQKRPNAFNLYDMHGNVYEWCGDWFGEYPSGTSVDPTGPSSGSSRVLRGGHWDDCAVYCRSASRFRLTPANRYSKYGFRVVLSRSGQ